MENREDFAKTVYIQNNEGIGFINCLVAGLDENLGLVIM